jgi:hypothetical protein
MSSGDRDRSMFYRSTDRRGAQHVLLGFPCEIKLAWLKINELAVV